MIRRGVVALLAMSLSGCAARGHIATPGEMALLRATDGLSSAGRITLEGPGGKVSARVVFGVARPDSLRIEIPAGTGLRFLLVSKEGRLRAVLPGDDAMLEGPATPAATAARARTGTNSRWPPDMLPWPPGSCTEWVASNTTGQPVSRMIASERMSETRLL